MFVPRVVVAIIAGLSLNPFFDSKLALNSASDGTRSPCAGDVDVDASRVPADSGSEMVAVVDSSWIPIVISLVTVVYYNSTQQYRGALLPHHN